MEPSDRLQVVGRSFTTQFDPRPAWAFVGAGLGLFGLAAMGTIALVKTIPLAPIGCVLALLFHFAPVLWPKKPAVDLGEDGFRLDGLGLIPWEAIGEIAYHEKPQTKAERKPKIALLEIDLIARFDLAIVRADDGPIWRRWQARHWRKLGDSHLTLLLTGLTDPPRDIRSAFEVFLGHAITGPRGLIA